MSDFTFNLLTSTRRRPGTGVLEDRTVPAFLAPVDYPAGFTPVAVVTADFNNDGQLDIAAGRYSESDLYESSVVVLLGNVDGTFRPPLTCPTGVYPNSLAVGDFDSDGKLDLATANIYGANVSVLRGNGDGTFQALSNISIGSSPAAVAVGDFNGDGLLDLGVTSNRYSDHPGDGYANVLIGHGDGTFSAPHTTPLLNNSLYTSAAAADLNGDGCDDFVTANFFGYDVEVLMGSGTGDLQGPSGFICGSSLRSVAAGDVNGDSIIDLVTANYFGSDIGVLLGDGLGNFSSAGNFATNQYPVSVVLGDFTGDGQVDAATLNEAAYEGVSVLRGHGDGTFSIELITPLQSGRGLAAGDFNRDGWLDAVTAKYGWSDVSVLINDQSWPPSYTLAINDVSVTEGNSGTTSAVFTVRLSDAIAVPVTVNYATADGTATAGSDYQSTSGTLTFAPGEVSKTIPVAVIGDRLGELNETFSVNLVSATNATIGDGTGIGTIGNDDPPTINIWDNLGVNEGDSGLWAINFTVVMSLRSDQPVTVEYSTADGTAIAGSDYQAASGTLTFAPFETSKTITVWVIGDVIDEDQETFTVNLSAPTNASLGDSQALGIIFDDDPSPPTVAINNVSVTEGNSGTMSAVFTVSLSHASAIPVAVNYATADGTASAGSDYQPAGGTLTIPAGQTTGTITVLVNGDRVVEPNETFVVNLSGPTNATIADGQGMGTIVNDDLALPTLSIGDVTITEGNNGTRSANFSVTLSAASSQPVAVAYATADGSAAAGSDYQAVSGTLTIPAGQTAGTINVLVNGDRLVEPNETFVVNLSSPTNAMITNGPAVGTILDDEPRVSISDVTKREGRKNTTSFVFTVTLSAAYDQPVTMSFQTLNGTATTGDNDYVAKSGALTFAPGERTKTITIVVNGDSKKEADETFFVDLFGNSSNSLFTNTRGIGTILNDD
jgi:Calx-beta domain/FG-GAP-like repeat